MSWYKTGTVNVTNNSNAVIGAGTAFISNSRVGDAFRGPDGNWYEVINIASDTAMSILPVYQGVSDGSGLYAIAPMQGYVKESADALRAASLVIGNASTDLSIQVNEAKAAAVSATTSANNASQSATYASSSEVSAKNSEVAAKESELNAAQSANSAGNVVPLVARFLTPAAALPATRDDGSPLQVGDRVLLTSDGLEYIYKSTGWVANNIDGQSLSSPSGATQVGASLPNGGTGTVQSALDQLKSRDVVYTTASPSVMSSLNIPASVTLVSTSYALTQGWGGALYRRYTGTYPADGFCIVQTADGAKWKAAGIPTPYLFGAVDGQDITDAFQRFLTYAATHDEPEMNWSVHGVISRQTSGTVAAGSSSYCKKITGKVRLIEPATSVQGALVTLVNFIQTSVGDGEYLGSIVFGSRKVWDAFVFKGCKYLDGGDFYVVGCVRHGVQVLDYTTEFKFGHIKALYCGSTKYQGVSFSAPTHFRTGSVLDQRSNFQGFTSPPGVRAGDGIMINGSFYHIRVIDTAGMTMQVFPALDTKDLNNISTAVWCFGGGFRHADGETNAGWISRFSGLVNAIGITCDDLYPVSVGKAASQLESIQIRVGTDRNAAYRGGSINDTYTENTQIACVILGQGGNNPYGYGHVGQFTPDSYYQFLDYINDDLTKNTQRNVPTVITDFNKRTVVPRTTQSPYVSTVCGNTELTVITVEETTGGFGKTIKLVADKAMTSAHGSYSVAFYVLGASSGNPGTITITGESGVLVMSQASYSVALTGPVLMLGMYSNGNWTVHKSVNFTGA